MRQKFKILSSLLAIIASIAFAYNAHALEKMGSDDRIRTFVYGENDVFRIITLYGYQTVIEFEEDELIKTISMGDPSPFKLNPQKNKIFLKSIIDGQITNLTIITNKRTYNMEFSSVAEDVSEIMYVVRFFYPDSVGKSFEIGDVDLDKLNLKMNVGDVNVPASMAQKNTPTYSSSISSFQNNLGNMLEQQQTQLYGANSGSNQPYPSMGMTKNSNLNYDYSLKGAKEISPTEIYDDGSNTYITYSDNMLSPKFQIVNFDGSLSPISSVKQGNKHMLAGVAAKIMVNLNGKKICIYNEKLN